MATFKNDYQDIFGQEEVNDFECFSREELDFNSDIEVQKNTVQYSENESEDIESQSEDEAMQCSQQTGQKH